MKKESNIDNIIQSLLGKYKVKYEYLDNVINKKIDAVHINIDSIINDYISMNITSKLSSENSNSAIFSIASSILNTAAHYKHYFTKNKTNVIINSLKKPRSNAIIERTNNLVKDKYKPSKPYKILSFVSSSQLSF